MSENQEKITQAAEMLRGAVGSLRGGEYAAASKSADDAYNLIDRIQDDIASQVERLSGTESPEHTKLQAILDDLLQVTNGMQQQDPIDELDNQDDANALADELEDYATILDEINL